MAKDLYNVRLHDMRFNKVHEMHVLATDVLKAATEAYAFVTEGWDPPPIISHVEVSRVIPPLLLEAD